MKLSKNVALFISSNIINRFGDSVDLIAFMWLTYEVTNSVMLTGIVAAFNGLPSIIFGLFSGVLTDYVNRKNLIIIGDVARGIIVCCIVVLYKFNLLNIYILCIATIFISIFEILSSPARRSMLPFLVKKEDLRTVNSKNAAGKIISQMLGLSTAGVIIGFWGLSSAVMLDAVTFFISAILIFKIDINTSEKKRREKHISVIYGVKDAVIVIKKERIILKTTIMATLVNLFIGGFNVLVLSYCINILGNNSQGQSVINTLSVIGIFLVSLYFSKTKKNINLENVINIGFIGLGLCFVMLGLCSSNICAYSIAILYGIATGCITISSVTILHRNIPLMHMGKVMALVSLVNESSIPFGNLLVSIMLENFTVQLILLVYGVMMIVSSLLIIYFFMKKKIEHENCS